MTSYTEEKSEEWISSKESEAITYMEYGDLMVESKNITKIYIDESNFMFVISTNLNLIDVAGIKSEINAEPRGFALFSCKFCCKDSALIFIN